MKTITIVLALMSPVQVADTKEMRAIEEGAQCRVRCDWQCLNVPDDDEWKDCHKRCLSECRKPGKWDYE